MLELDTFTKFTENWQNCPLDQLALELSSVNLETHHQVDRYNFLVGDDDFISPETGKLIRPIIKDETSLQKREKIVYEDTYKWAKNNESGLAAWISPPSEGLFPGTKIILHEIAGKGREKLVLNRTFLADMDTNDALYIANLFSTVSQKPKEIFDDPEEVRSQLFIFKEGVSVIDLLNLFIDDPELVEQVKSGQDLEGREEVIQKAKEYSKMLKSGASSQEVYTTMVSEGFIGSYDISCPPTSGSFSEYMVGHSLVSGEYKFIKNCGNCGVVIGKLIKKGYKCSSCHGEYKGC